MSNVYIVNGELTENAHLGPDLIRKCKFNVSEGTKVQVPDDGNSNAPKTRQYWHRFAEVTYPNGEKSQSIILPACAMYHKVELFFKKPSIVFGVSRKVMEALESRISSGSATFVYQDNKLIPDDNYIWFRDTHETAKKDREFIRMIDGDDEVFYSSFEALYKEVPSSVLANITCQLKFKTSTDIGSPLTGKETWHIGFTVTMFNVYDLTEVDPPASGTTQRSIAGKKDEASSKLIALRNKSRNAK